MTSQTITYLTKHQLNIHLHGVKTYNTDRNKAYTHYVYIHLVNTKTDYSSWTDVKYTRHN